MHCANVRLLEAASACAVAVASSIVSADTTPESGGNAAEQPPPGPSDTAVAAEPEPQPGALPSERQRTTGDGAVVELAESGATPAASARLPSSGEGQGAPPAATKPEPVERAIELFRQAESKYVAGDVAGALRLMQQSYQLSRRPELLFNLGQLNRELKQCRPALQHYRDYLEQVPAARRGPDAAAAVRQLERECGKVGPAVERKPEPPRRSPVDRSYWDPPRIAGWAVIAAGVAAGAGMARFALSAEAKERRYEQLQKDTADRHDNWDDPRASQLEAEGQRDATWAVGLGVASAGMVACGALLLVFGPQADEHQPAALALDVQPRGLRITHSISF